MNQKSKNEIIEDMMRRPIPRKKGRACAPSDGKGGACPVWDEPDD